MRKQSFDAGDGHRLAEALRELGVRGMLIIAAERGRIGELRCAMPECLCPRGPTFFQPRDLDLLDWMPTADHYPVLKAKGGRLTVDNVRLAHRLCNRVDYAKQIGKPYAKDLAKAAAFPVDSASPASSDGAASVTIDADRRRAWAPLIESVAAAPAPLALRHKLLKHALRLASEERRRVVDFASAAAADHVKLHHGGRPFTTCGHLLLERAHPVDVAAVARDVANGVVSADKALQRLSPVVLLMRDEHRAVGDFGTTKQLERLLGAPLVDWRDARKSHRAR